ncbi:hypothetical protein acsn021_24220 [Anaerocolumna cellulosilytica]|uniref:Uncharacterized protein n=1 Tax=Anaerocolumna cellulosilytica TaxID=433286 RepID=A0A6S6QU72_9FIRM|nr:radical SAM protein [Anaerocolumna cellulosilytica]MBB5193933.1 radical SAM superfamily enzyme YgiQ (UPF0313 family) [Anaerocolumna cellulosilytica]BCJ94853.1 hypothetical protein acsn021_24220 [Anaerocolumna cellulosilytica]
MNIVIFEWRSYSSLFQRINLGIQYIAASLRKAGHNVFVNVFEGQTVEEVYKAVMSFNADIVAMTLYPENKKVVYELADRIKKENPEIVVISGGHTATLYAAKILKEQKNIDIITYGESELTYIDICQRLEAGKSLDDCRSIYYRKDGYIKRNSPRDQIDDLDSLPLPAEDIIRTLNNSNSPNIFTSVSTSRGCLGNCDFCVSHRVSKAVKYSRWRGRTPKNILEELIKLQQSFPDKRVVVEFVDSSFEDPDPRGKKRIIELMDLIEKSGIKIAFSFLTRAESWDAKDAALIKRMKKLGLFSVSPGFESGSDNSLISFGKRASVENNLNAFDVFSKNGVDVCGLIIMFHPYVTFKDLRHNADFLVKVGVAYRPLSWLHSLYVFPDTKIFQRIALDGLITGVDESDFEYTYMFQDGRIEKLSALINKINGLDSVRRFENTCDKLAYELRLYEVWKDMYEEFEKISDEMREYKTRYHEMADAVGKRLYETFNTLIDAAENDTLSHIGDNIVKEWDTLLSDNQVRLEQQWMSSRLKLMRKGIKIL